MRHPGWVAEFCGTSCNSAKENEERGSPVSWLSALIVEGCVGDEGGHIDVPHPVQEQAEILRCEAVKAAGRQHVKQTCGGKSTQGWLPTPRADFTAVGENVK